MNYNDHINLLLNPDASSQFTAIDLFSGCGGLALGFAATGFSTIGYEIDTNCCSTYEANLKHECINTALDEETVYRMADIVIGGPPCQPFSVGGLQKGVNDVRNGFPSFISAIKQLNPDIWVFENVRGLLYKNKWYLDKIISELESLAYIVDVNFVNAVNYGVPQNRERIFVVGHRGVFRFPKKSERVIASGEALGDMIYTATEDSKFLTPSMDRYVANYEKASKCINPRDLNLEKPARTLTCRNLAGATGDMHRIKLPDGRRRRLTTREAARLQTFPDWFVFSGKESSVYKQIGNAVPPLLSYAIAQSVKEYLLSDFRYSQDEILNKGSYLQAELQFS